MSVSIANQLADILASSAEGEARELVRRFEAELHALPLRDLFAGYDYLKVNAREYHESWKRRIISELARDLILAKPPIENPVSLGLRQLQQLTIAVRTHTKDKLSAAIQLATAWGMMVILFLLWPFGMIPVVEDTFRRLMLTAVWQAEYDTETPLEKMPHAIAIGIYGLVWSTLALLALPLLALGWLCHILLLHRG
jgi:hypothetical protein